ncbi:MAG: UvrD-helicase domain-containing protein [Anaerolineae bacterium]|nr:UvrD-helicase domain-containing protein [Anaerolineae bacterium]
MTSSSILAGLNPQQVEAVTAGDGPVLVLAGPGSGKTRVLTHRIAYLVEERDIRAWHIMAVTFTNKAAREMENRVVRLLLDESGKLDGLAIGTFHAICARILRREADLTTLTRDYAIFDTSDQLAVMKQTLGDLNLDVKKYNPRGMLSNVSSAKNELITPEDYPANDYRAEVMRRVYIQYNNLLRANNARDFDDLLMHTAQLFQDHPDVLARYQQRYYHILVDEFQDTNMAQYVLVKLLAGQRRNLFAVGDPDQSIYAFRGADYRNVQRFREDYSDTQLILLEQNYRSHQAILDAATGVINQNPGRIQKELFSQRKDGALLMVYEAYNEDDEARYVVDTIAELVARNKYHPGEFAIMYRTNAQSRAIEDAFIRAGLPYRLIGATRFYARREVKDVMAYMRLIHNPDDNVGLQRIVNVPPRGIGKKTLETLDDWAHELGTTPIQALFALLDGFDSPFSARARRALITFAEMLRAWQATKDDLPPAEILTNVLKQTRYLDYLDDGTPEGDSRIENVLELRTVAASYGEVPLATFLEEVSLVSDVDTHDDEAQAPNLLTLHAAKGLEFPVVFIVGLEEGVLPHIRSMDDPNQMQEERRLMYVGLTRAKDRVYLIYAVRRALYGDSRANIPSRFLYDIPEEVREGTLLGKRGQSDAAQQHYDTMTRWERVASGARQRQSPREYQRTRFKAGDCVWHQAFGEGVVVSSMVRGPVEEVDVLFPGGGGQKTIIADFLKPMES